MAKATGVEVARISVKVHPNTKEFRAELRRELENIERTMKGDVHIVAHLRTAQARADFNRLVNSMERAGAKGVRIRTDLAVDEDRIRKDLDKVQERVDKITEQQQKGGGNKIGAVAGSKKKGGILSQWPSFGSGINPAGWGVILAAVLALAAPVIGFITTALLALPGIVALISAPIAAITLGLEGFLKAAQSINEPFERLKKTMSDVNEKAFTPFFQAIADRIFPSLESKMPAVSNGLAQMAQGFTDAFARPENVAMFENSLQRIGDFFAQIRPGMDSFLSGFIGLVDQFTQKLPGLGDWINNTGQDFLNWVKEISESGQLSVALDGLGASLKTILDALGGMGKAGFEFFSNPEKVQQFVDGLGSVKDFLVDIVELSNKLADSPLFGPNMLPDFSWEGFVDDITAPFTSEKAPWRLFFKEGSIAEQQAAIEQRGERDGQIYAAALQQSIDAGTQLGMAPGMQESQVGQAVKQQLVEQLQTTKEEQVAALKSALSPDAVNEAVTNQLSESVSNAMVAATQAVQASASTLQTGINSALEPLESLPDKIGTAMSSATAAFEKLPEAAKTAADGAVTAISESAGPAGEAATAVGNAAVEALMGTVDMFSGVGVQMMMGLAGGIKAGSAAVVTAAVQAAIAAKTAAEGALGIKSPSKVFAKIGDQTMQGFKVGMEDGVQPVIDQAKALAWKISEAFASGADPTSALAGLDGRQVSAVEKTLGFEAKRLAYQARALEYQSKVTGNTSLKDQAEAIRMKREEIMLQKDMIDLTQEYAELNGQGQGSDWLGDSLKRAGTDLFGAPFDFAGATANQFMSDLGMSGNGAVGALMDYGMQFGKSAVGSVFNFNVSNADEAIAIKNNQINKEALGVVGSR